jgi:hypothetical protein
VIALLVVLAALVVLSVGYHYCRWSRIKAVNSLRSTAQGTQFPVQGKAILGPPLQDLLLPTDTKIKTRLSWPTGEWCVVFVTTADWSTVYSRVSQFLDSKGYRLDPRFASNPWVRRWNSAHGPMSVTLNATTPITQFPPKPDERSGLFQYGIIMFLPPPLASSKPPRIENGQ